jgi:hypothetical protein
MKKILAMLILVPLLHASTVKPFESREGFHGGVGIIALLDGTVFPMLDLEIGYNLSNQFGISLDIKTLLIGSYIGVKAKYYFEDTKNSTFASLILCPCKLDGKDYDMATGYNGIELGYALGHNEFSVGVGVPTSNMGTFFHLGYKYIF